MQQMQNLAVVLGSVTSERITFGATKEWKVKLHGSLFEILANYAHEIFQKT